MFVIVVVTLELKLKVIAGGESVRKGVMLAGIEIAHLNYRCNSIL